jgi:hypothetical protein
MELFSEIHGIYYRLVKEILQAMPLKEQEIRKIVADHGMPESTLHFLPQLLDDRAWPLFEEEKDTFVSKLKNPSKTPLSILEKSWLKALLQGPRTRLFLSDEEFQELADKLEKETPLYDPKDFSYFDCCLDGDNYSDPTYRENFQKILAALHEKKPLQINFTSGKGKKVSGHYVPLKLEYSEKDDKFRLYCAHLRYERNPNYFIINLARIDQINESSQMHDENFRLEHYFAQKRTKDPIIVEISKERNAIERFMVEFSAYEKSSEFDDNTEKCTATIFYSKDDETEVLIKILSFGPTICVTSPPSFIRLIRERINKQAKLLQTPNEHHLLQQNI